MQVCLSNQCWDKLTQQSNPTLWRSKNEGHWMICHFHSTNNLMLGMTYIGRTRKFRFIDFNWMFQKDIVFTQFLLLTLKLVKVVKNLPASAGDMGSIPESGRSPEGKHGNPLHILAWRIPWTEEPGGLQSMGSQREDMTELMSTHAYIHLPSNSKCVSKFFFMDVSVIWAGWLFCYTGLQLTFFKSTLQFFFLLNCHRLLTSGRLPSSIRQHGSQERLLRSLLCSVYPSQDRWRVCLTHINNVSYGLLCCRLANSQKTSLASLQNLFPELFREIKDLWKQMITLVQYFVPLDSFFQNESSSPNYLSKPHPLSVNLSELIWISINSGQDVWW